MVFRCGGMNRGRRCQMRISGKGDAEKARYWQRTIREAAQSGISVRQFCRQRRLKESQFYGRGRDGDYSPPPAQIRTSGITACGSCQKS
jgi:hypothetical protein